MKSSKKKVQRKCRSLECESIIIPGQIVRGIFGLVFCEEYICVRAMRQHHIQEGRE